jgi:hypothetical protein
MNKQFFLGQQFFPMQKLDNRYRQVVQDVQDVQGIQEIQQVQDEDHDICRCKILPNHQRLAVDYLCFTNNVEKLLNLDNSNNLNNSNNSNETRTRVCFVKQIPWQPDLPERFRFIYKKLKPLIDIKDATKRIDYYEHLTPVLKHHPCITVVRNESTNEIIDVVGKVEWFEKQQLSWWSLPRLKTMLQNGGCFRKHFFRVGFLSTLYSVIQQFTMTDKDYSHSHYPL